MPLRVVTKPMEVAEFANAIFTYANFSDDGTEPDVFSTLMSAPSNWGIQSLSECSRGGKNEEELRQALRNWGAVVGVANLAQFSLVRGRPVGALGRFDIEFRDANEQEIEIDRKEFGEEQMRRLTWAEAQEKGLKGPKFRAGGTTYMYPGPKRIAAFLFHTKIFPGELPPSLDELVRTIEEIAEKGEDIVPQAFHLYHARDGILRYCAFEKPEDYDPNNMNEFGKLVINGDNMTFINADRSSVDFTKARYHGP